MELMDFRDSFAIYTSAKDGIESNTCRTQILATCTLIDEGGKNPPVLHLAKECIGEYMYGGKIAQVPTSEVAIIFCEGPTALVKKFADHANDVVQIADMGGTRKSFDGSYAAWTDMRIMSRTSEAAPLKSIDDIIAATVDGLTIIARTTISASDDRPAAMLEYPVPYINFHPPIQRFQVDVGPILLPRNPVGDEPPVAQMEFAYIMYNDFESAEFAIRAPTPLGAESAVSTLHYSKVVSMKAKNELFCLDS
jgi:hypothetical protein